MDSLGLGLLNTKYTKRKRIFATDKSLKKLKDFNVEHAEVITSRMIQKITTQFVKHLKEEETAVDQSINVVSKIFELKELNYNESN